MNPINDTDVDHERLKRCLDVHLAEYNALTTRNTYWITLQYVVYGIAGAYLGYAVGVAASKSIPLGPLMWVSGLVLQLLGWGLLQIQYEIFNNVEYLERELKPAVKKLVGTNEIWGYEPFLAAKRSQPFFSFEWKYGLLIVFVFVFACIAGLIAWNVWGGPWSRWDTMWACANAYVAVIVATRARQNADARKRMISPEELKLPPKQSEVQALALQLLVTMSRQTKRVIERIRRTRLVGFRPAPEVQVGPDTPQDLIASPPVVAAAADQGGSQVADRWQVQSTTVDAGSREAGRQQAEETAIKARACVSVDNPRKGAETSPDK